VSTKGKATDGRIARHARAKLEAWALAHDATLGGVHVDAGQSGKTLERPAVQELLARCARRSLARRGLQARPLTRRTRDLLALVEDELKPPGVALVSLSEAIDTRLGPPASWCSQMPGAGADGARVDRGTHARRARPQAQQRERLGTTPLGFTTPAPREALRRTGRSCARARHFARRAAGATFRAIAAELAAAGHPTKRGGPEDGATVRKVWQARARYAGCAGLEVAA
jgi:DNA invertase Pin-like site-specific DNA recombinase